MKKAFLFFMVVCTVSLAAVGVWWKFFRADIQFGQKLVDNNCGVCHDMSSDKKNKKGPFLWGIVDRQAGTAPGYRYSTSFLEQAESAPFKWTEANLERFMREPSEFLPDILMTIPRSNHMISFEGIPSAANRRDLIAYLKTLQDSQE